MIRAGCRTVDRLPDGDGSLGVGVSTSRFGPYTLIRIAGRSQPPAWKGVWRESSCASEQYPALLERLPVVWWPLRGLRAHPANRAGQVLAVGRSMKAIGTCSRIGFSRTTASVFNACSGGKS